MNTTRSWPPDPAITPADEAYLWDGSGEPAADLRRIEALLEPLRHRGAAPDLAGALDDGALPEPHAMWHVWAVAAALALAILAPWITLRLAPATAVWSVAWIGGGADAGHRSALAVGQALDTGIGGLDSTSARSARWTSSLAPGCASSTPGQRTTVSRSIGERCTR